MIIVRQHNGLSILQIIIFNIDSAVQYNKKIKILPTAPRYLMRFWHWSIKTKIQYPCVILYHCYCDHPLENKFSMPVVLCVDTAVGKLMAFWDAALSSLEHWHCNTWRNITSDRNSTITKHEILRYNSNSFKSPFVKFFLRLYNKHSFEISLF